jgi:hypothetical protein
MKKIYFAFALMLSLAGTKNSFGQCGLTISPSASTVCSGDAVTLTATATPPVNASTLTTTMAAGNNHRGNMFDITATNSVTISSFDASPMGNTTIAVYYKTGTYAGFANTPGAWTLIGSAAVTAMPAGTPTPVPVAVNVTIPAGQTYAFYVTSTNTAVSLNYTDGTAVGATYVSDASINFKQGVGLEYPFTAGTGSTFSPRVWNGVIHYTTPAPTPTITYLWNTSAATSAITPTVIASSQYTVQASVTGCPTMYDTVDIAVSIPVVNAGNDTAICEGSMATLSASGAISYSWNNGVSNGVGFAPSSTMSYMVTGTDTYGCTATDNVTVTVNTLPNVDAGAYTNVCNGSSATLSGSGAVSYTWDNGVTDGLSFVPTATMPYNVTGTDTNGCSSTDTVTVNVLSLPVVDAGADATICSGSSIILSGSGAVSYAWDNGVTDGVAFSPASTMSYEVTGTDANGCMDTNTVMITVDPLPVVSAGTDQAVCAGSDVTLTGAGATSYTWNNGVTDGVAFTASPGSYIVTGTDANGCSANDTMMLSINTVNVATTTSGFVITAAAAGTASYQWIDCGTSTAISAETSQSYTVTANGDYAVVITENGCSDTSACVPVIIEGMADLNAAGSLSVFPNPNNGTFVITANAAGVYRIVNELGQTIQTIRLNAENNYSFNMEQKAA